MFNDQGYFKEYPAPIFEASCKDHIAPQINHTTPYYGPLLYWLIRCCGARNVAEIGVAYGWTSYFMASGVKDNLIRQGVTNITVEQGQYYGIDPSLAVTNLQEQCRNQGLPATFLQMDSYDLTPEHFLPTNSFGLVFIDGWHSAQHLYKEMELFYPMVVDGGRGYIVIHDCYAWVYEPLLTILKDPKYKFEYIRFFDNYGLAILRKMDNYTADDNPRKMWAEGAQEDIR
jgi:hypothetical protein